jgi:hypothetical protein
MAGSATNLATFEYCDQRWELAKARTYQLSGAAVFADKVHNCGLSISRNESHIRPLLARLETDEADGLRQARPACEVAARGSSFARASLRGACRAMTIINTAGYWASADRDPAR